MLNARVVKLSNGLRINTLCTQVVNIANATFWSPGPLVCILPEEGPGDRNIALAVFTT